MTSKVLPGFPEILDTQTQTYSLNCRDHNEWMHIIYIDKIEKNKGTIHVKTLHSSNPDSWRKGVQIKNAQVIAGIQKIGNKIVLCLHEKFKERVPSKNKKISVENEGKYEKFKFTNYILYKEKSYNEFLDNAYEFYGKMIYNILKKNGLLK